MLELTPRTRTAKRQADASNPERRRLLIALTLLLFALGVVLVKDRDFWFGSDEAVETASADSENIQQAGSKSAAAKAIQPKAAESTNPKTRPTAKAPSASAVAKRPETETANADSPAVATKRTILPPLEVEVVAGDNHRIVRPGSNVSKVEIQKDSNHGAAVSASVQGPATNAAEREILAPANAPELRQTVDATYPLLGQHAKVQGSVVLQAVVGADGAIENLRVLSGPAILSTAAQQAVRQWRFKPVLQNGQPVETKARITVNFSIRVSDNPANAS